LRGFSGRWLGLALGLEEVFDALVSIPLSSTLSFGQVFLLENQDVNAARAIALGERLRLSVGNGAPIHKQIVGYYRRAKKERGIRVKDSLLLEAVESLNAPQIHYQSKPVVGFATQTSLEVAYGQAVDLSPTPLSSVGDVAAQRKNSNPIRGFLRRGFLNPSPTEKKESHSSSLVAIKEDDVDGGSSSALEKAFKFGWDQEDNDWDGGAVPRSP
jgi:hypothetical protein